MSYVDEWCLCSVYMYLFVCLSAYLLVCLFVCLFVCLSVCLFVCLFVCLCYVMSLSNFDTLTIPVFKGSKCCRIVATSCPFTLIPVKHIQQYWVFGNICIRIPIIGNFRGHYVFFIGGL